MITKFELAPPGWNLATVNRDRDSEGALFHPVIAWGLTDGGTVIPLCASKVIGETGADLAEPSQFDEDDLLGLVAPGEELNPCWNDMAREQVREEEAEEKHQEDKQIAEKIAKSGHIEMHHTGILEKAIRGEPILNAFSRLDVMVLLQFDCVHLHFSNSIGDRERGTPGVYITNIGREVLKLRQVIEAEIVAMQAMQAPAPSGEVDMPVSPEFQVSLDDQDDRRSDDETDDGMPF